MVAVVIMSPSGFTWFGAQGLGQRVYGLVCRVSGFWFLVSGFWCLVEGVGPTKPLGCRVSGADLVAEVGELHVNQRPEYAPHLHPGNHLIRTSTRVFAPD